MKNNKAKKLIFSTALIVLILFVSIVISSQDKGLSLLSIFKSYKIRLENETIKLKKADGFVALGLDDLKAMLSEQYGTSDIYIDFSIEEYKPNENNIILLPEPEKEDNKTYTLGRIFFVNNEGWTVGVLELSFDENKYLYIIDDNDYINASENSVPDIHARLINRDHIIPDDFNSQNIVELKGVKAILSSKEMKIDISTLEALKEMMDAADQDGVKGYVISSSYRSYQHQKNLFDYRLETNKNKGVEDPFEETTKLVAYPGTSEHQTGMALDISSLEYPKGADFNKSKEYEWLMKNCWNYGFVPRYPENKVEKTGISFEPWHYRYIGKPLSLYAKETGYCLEEVVENLEKNKFTEFEVSDKERYIFLFTEKNKNFMIQNSIDLEFFLLELTAQNDLIVIKLTS